MAEPFSAESRLIQDGYYGGRVLADRLRPLSTRPVPVDLRDLAAAERALSVGVEPAADLITDIDQALEVL